jgi:hypothetical protein
MRFRATSTSSNGEPALSTPGGEDDPVRICWLRNATGDLAVISFPAGGSVSIKPGALARDRKPQWYNPRSGQRIPASSSIDNTIAAPDQNDWALLFRDQP